MSIKSKEYWKKRADKEEKKVYKDGDKLLKEFEKNLNKAKKEIQSGINDLIIKYMDRTELSYAEAMKYLTSSEFKEWRMTLEEYMKEIDRMSNLNPEIAKRLKLELETLATKSRISRLDTLNAQIDVSLSKKSYEEQEGLKTALGSVYKDSYKSLRLDFGVESSSAILDDKIIKDLIAYPWSGTDYSSRIWENRSALSKVLKQEIVQSFIQGISVKDLTNKMMGRLESDRKNTERLVRTELSYALNKATKLSYEDSEIEEYEYLAEIDSRTSQECKKLNGQVFKTEDAKAGVNYPPMHPHCRSTTIPVISYENIGKQKKNYQKNDIIEEKEKFNNFTEAKKGLENKGVVFKDNLSKLDEKLLLDNANKLNELLSKYEEAQKYVKENTFTFDTKRGSFIGMCSSNLSESSQTIYLNPEYFKNYDKYIEQQMKQIENKWKMPALKEKAASYTISHEFGHFIQNILFKKIKEKNPGEWEEIKKKALSKTTNSATLRIIRGWYNNQAKMMKKDIVLMANKLDNNVNLKNYKEYISEYGETDPHEFFAECFANLECGNPNILGKAIENYLKEVF